MQQTVLVAIDLSNPEPAQEMIAIAHKFAGHDARVILLHVVEDVPDYIAAQLPSDVLKKSGEIADSALREIAAEAGTHAEPEVRTGHAGNQILKAATERGADLIVIASHRPGLQDYFLGSTAGRVVRRADCSVYVMR